MPQVTESWDSKSLWGTPASCLASQQWPLLSHISTNTIIIILNTSFCPPQKLVSSAEFCYCRSRGTCPFPARSAASTLFHRSVHFIIFFPQDNTKWWTAGQLQDCLCNRGRLWRGGEGVWLRTACQLYCRIMIKVFCWEFNICAHKSQWNSLGCLLSPSLFV